MAFVLPPLPYATNALEPFIDAKTMEIHHTKHHQAYINNANAKLEGQPALANKSAEEIISNPQPFPKTFAPSSAITRADMQITRCSGPFSLLTPEQNRPANSPVRSTAPSAASPR